MPGGHSVHLAAEALADASVPMLPAAQGRPWQDNAPWCSDQDPLTHAEHVALLEDVAPVAPKKPGSQSVPKQCCAPALDENFPGSQTMHSFDSNGACHPAGQMEQPYAEAVPLDATSPAKPSAQTVQAATDVLFLDIITVVMPRGQDVQRVAPAAE